MNNKEKIKEAFKDPKFSFVGPEANHDIVVQWSAKHIGFGEFSFYMKDGKLRCGNECMDKEFVRKTLMALVDEAEFMET